MESKIFGIDQNALNVPDYIAQALGVLRSNHYYIHNKCRFELYKDLYRKYYLEAINLKNEDIIKSHEKEILYGYKDYWELLYIARSRTINLCNKVTVRKEIETIFQGAVLESTNSSPWNYQFQYLLSSIFERSGFEVSLEEPDFQFKYKGKRYSVAAKRLNGKNSIGRNIKEAEEQISKTDNYGFIALSLDKIYKDNNEIETFKDPDNSIRTANEMIEHIIKNYLQWRYFSERSNQILGIIAHITFPFKYRTNKPVFELGYSAFTSFLPISPPDTSSWNEVIEINDSLHRIDIRTLS